MKKRILSALSVLICTMTIPFVEARTTVTPALASAIKLYKAKNYSQCYNSLQTVVKKDPSNALAYYYLAMTSAQIGKREEAITNYSKVISLSPNSQLGKYATKGKTCIESPENCHADVKTEELSAEEKFIRSGYGSGFSQEVRGDYEKKKIENLMREMNRNNGVEPQKFKEYKDFSGEVPTNDEIVAALRTLQRAGLSDIISNNNNISELSLLTGNSNINQQDDIFNLLTGANGSSKLSPQVIQSLLTNQMSVGF